MSLIQTCLKLSTMHSSGYSPSHNFITALQAHASLFTCLQEWQYTLKAYAVPKLRLKAIHLATGMLAEILGCWLLSSIPINKGIVLLGIMTEQPSTDSWDLLPEMHKQNRIWRIHEQVEFCWGKAHTWLQPTQVLRQDARPQEWPHSITWKYTLTVDWPGTYLGQVKWD